MSIVDTLNATGVTVLCGGPGAEREVSLQSGDQASKALERAGVRCRKVVVPAEGYAEFLESLPLEVALLMFHGEWGEDGGAQAILERRRIPYNGSDARASTLAMDKNGCKLRFVGEGIPTARWAVAGSATEAAEAVRREELRFPVFVKPNYRGSSVATGRVNCFNELDQAVDKALAVDSLAIVEEMVDGRDLTISWLEGRSLPVIEIGSQGVFYDYEAKYLSDKTTYQCPAELDEQTTAVLCRMAEKVADCIGARDYARVDIMLGDDGPMVLEINTLPGYTSHSLFPMAAAAAGIGIEELTVKLAAMAAARAGMLPA